MTACPVCDLEQEQLTPIECIALGIALARAYDSDAPIGDMTCAAHRMPLIMALATLATKLPVGR